LNEKYFVENILCIFWCLVQPKMMANRNHFQFDRKSLLKMIYGFKNYKSFFGFKFFILVGTFVGIRHSRALEFVGSPNLPLNVSEFWYPITGFQRQ
jgi:hypothetical protein